MNKTLISALCAQFFMANIAMAQSHSGHAHHHLSDDSPVGIMGGHNHKAGGWMLSYRHSQMRMEGNRHGQESVSDEEIASQGYMIAPQDMKMEMHMVGVMYGVSDKLTLMGMLPYKEVSMDHKFVKGMHNGKSFRMRAEGIADIKLSGVYTLKEWGEHRLYGNFGVLLPTGSINKRDVNSITGVVAKLPYPMQIGSGTYGVLPGMTYTGYQGDWSWGGQASVTVRLGQNTDEYTLGDIYAGSVWGAKKLSDWISLSLCLDGSIWGNIDGTDPELTNTAMAPTFRTDLRAGQRIDGLLGVNVTIPHGELRGNRLSVEFGAPLYQDLDGPQLETDYRFMIGWQKEF